MISLGRLFPATYGCLNSVSSVRPWRTLRRPESNSQHMILIRSRSSDPSSAPPTHTHTHALHDHREINNSPKLRILLTETCSSGVRVLPIERIYKQDAQQPWRSDWSLARQEQVRFKFHLSPIFFPPDLAKDPHIWFSCHYL